MPPKSRRISASQVGQYAYCARAWWLAIVEKHAPENPAVLNAGTQAHERHGWQLSLSQSAGKLALILAGIGLLLFVVWALAAMGR